MSFRNGSNQGESSSTSFFNRGDPHDEIHRQIADAERVNNYSDCVALCSQGILIYPQETCFLLMKARFLVLSYQSLEANAILQEIISNDSDNAEAISTLGMVFYYQRNFKKSVEVFDKALGMDKRLLEIVTFRKKAIRYIQILEKLPDVDPKEIYLTHRRKAPIEVEFTEDVRVLIEEGLKIDVTNREAMKVLRFKQGLGSFLNKNHQRAIEVFTEALKFDENNLAMFMLRALSYIAVCFFDDAMIDLLEVETLNEGKCSKTSKEIEHLRSNIGKVYVAKTNYDFLEISRNANENEIMLSYKTLTLLHQVNMSKAETEAEKRKLIFKFKRVENAFAILSRQEYKEQYDNLLKKQEEAIECPTLTTCCINIGIGYQCLCGATGNCIGTSFRGIGSCIGDSFKGIGSCFKTMFTSFESCSCCSQNGLKFIFKTLNLCNIIIAVIVFFVLYLILRE